jgi:hypothetical protein
MKTRRELIDQVLDNLGVLVPGQAPGDESVSRVDALVNPALATLAGLGIVYVADAGNEDPPTDGEIDDAIFIPLASWVAWQCAGAFNLGNDPSLKVLADQAELVLRTLSRPAPTRQLLRTDGQLRGIRTRMPIGNFTQGT